jgi:hypothetical protein
MPDLKEGWFSRRLPAGWGSLRFDAGFFFEASVPDGLQLPIGPFAVPYLRRCNANASLWPPYCVCTGLGFGVTLTSSGVVSTHFLVLEGT